MQPEEKPIFAWGSELLPHQTYPPAKTVFARGAELFPRSAKLEAGLGIALYLSGSYEEAIHALCSATDLNPSDSWPYLFLGRMYNTSDHSSEEVRTRLGRFEQLQPKNPQALYYYAMALWSRGQKLEANLAQVESLLKEAITQDTAYADAQFQLGILFADQGRNSDAIQQFHRSIALQPNLTTAHYHLAQAYRREGEKERAGHELQIFDRLRKRDQAETDTARKEVKQFIIDLKEQAPAVN